VSLEEMLATVGTMRNAGLEASMAGTAYRMMLEKLPDLHKKTGMAVSDATGRMRPLLDILKELKAHYGEELTVGELGELSQIFDVRAVGGVKALLMNIDELEKMTREMGNSAGAAFEMFEKRMAGAGAQMKALRNEYDDASATLAMKLLPTMREKQRLLTQAVETMEKIPGAKEALIGVDLVAEVGKLAGPLLGVIGLGMSWVTQRRIAIAVERQLQLELAKTAAATGGAGAAGAAGAGAGAAARGAGAGAAGAGIGTAAAVALPIALSAAALYWAYQSRNEPSRLPAFTPGGFAGREATEVKITGPVSITVSGARDGRTAAEEMFDEFGKLAAREGLRQP